MHTGLVEALNALLKRPFDEEVTSVEAAVAIKASQRTVERREVAHDYSVAELERAAAYFGLNPTSLLVEMGVLSWNDVTSFTQGVAAGPPIDYVDDYGLAKELARRLSPHSRAETADREALHKAESDAADAVEASLNTVGRTARQENRLQG